MHARTHTHREREREGERAHARARERETEHAKEGREIEKEEYSHEFPPRLKKHSAGNGYVLECVNEMCSARLQSSPGTVVAGSSRSLYSIFSGTGTDNYGGMRFFSFSLSLSLFFFLSFHLISEEPSKKKMADPHCIWNPVIRRWILTGYQQVNNWRRILFWNSKEGGGRSSTSRESSGANF